MESVKLEKFDYRKLNRHSAFLHHPRYNEYQRMPKMFAGEDDVSKLEYLGNNLMSEVDPVFLNAAGSAFLEASIAGESLDVSTRLALFGKAQLAWQFALSNEEIASSITSEMSSCVDVHRVAVNLACLPMTKGLILGDIKDESMQESIESLIRIADVCELERSLASKEYDYDSVGHYIGLEHEINAILAFIYRKNPRYIAIPSSERAGTGYIYPEQTHDLTVISQHFGDIRSIMPVEVKARAGSREKRRYKALIVRGKMHLSSPGYHMPEYAKNAIKRYVRGEPTQEDIDFLGSMDATIKMLTSEYKSSGAYKPLKKEGSKMTYYSA